MDARRRQRLAPLNPDAFFAWAWRTNGGPKGRGPITLDDLWFDWGPGLTENGGTLAELRRRFVSMAAKVRRNQRLGREPWEGIGGCASEA
jgi:hypothetical protein